MFAKAVALLSQAFRVDVRQLRTHLLRGCVTAGVLWMLAIIQIEMRRSGSPGLEFCGVLAFSTMALLTLMGAFYFPSVITEEKEEQTLGLLRMAGVGSATLLLGKSIGRVGVILLLIAVTLPYWWLAITLGGVTSTQVASIAVTLAAHLALMSQIGTLCSVIFSTTGRACVASTLAILALLAGPGIAEEILSNARILRGYPTILSPLYQHMAPYQLGTTLRAGFTGNIVTLQAVMGFAAAGVLFLISWFLLDRLNTYDQVAKPERRWLTRLKGMMPTFARVHRKPRRCPSGWQVGAAVSWKDFWLFGGRWKWWIIRIALFSFLSFLFVLEGWGTFSKRLGVGFIVTTFWAFIAEVVFHSGHLFQRELKEQTWDSLRMLPVTTLELCVRKILGVIPALFPTLALFFLGCLLEADGGRGLLEELAEEFGRHPFIFVCVVMYVVACFLFATSSTCYFGIRVNPWLGTVISAALFGFVVFSTFWCGFEIMNLDSNDTAGLVFFFGACLNFVLAAGFQIPILNTLNGESQG